MPDFVERDTGQTVTLEGVEAEAAYLSGDYGLPHGTDVPLVAPDGGDPGLVASHDVANALAQGYRFAHPDEVKHAQAQAEYGGAKGTALAGAAGALRGITLGASDKILTAESGGALRKDLAGLREANPGTSIGSEIAGAVAPAILSGGESAIAEGASLAERGAVAAAEGTEAAASAGAATAKGASTLGTLARGAAKVAAAPSDLVGAAGRATERVVQSALGTGTAAKVAAKVAGNAVAGAAYNMGAQVSEDALGDHETTAEKLLASGLHGALLGGAAGGALSADGEIGSALLGRAAPTLRGVAESQAWRAISGRKAFQTIADKIPGGERAIGRVLLDDGIVAAGDRVQEIAPKLSAARQKAGAEIGGMLDAADAAGIEGPSVKRIEDRVRAEVLPDLEKLRSTNAAPIKRVENLIADMKALAPERIVVPDPIRERLGTKADELIAAASSGGAEARQALESMGARFEKAPPTFRQMQSFRAELDDIIKRNTNPLGPVDKVTEAMNGVRAAIENEIVEAGDAATGKLGKSWREGYEGAKLKYRRLITADKAAQDTVQRFQANAMASLTDKLMGAGAMNAVLGHHIAAGGAMLGGGIAGLAAGAVGAGVSHVLRTRGASTGAAVIDKLAALGGLQRAAAAVDREVDRGIAGVLRPGERVPSVRRSNPYRDHQDRAEAVARAVVNLDDHAAAIEHSASAIAPHAPKTAAAYQSAALRATAWLAQQIPASMKRPPDPLLPQFDEAYVSPTDAASFVRKFDAVHDPASVLDDMRTGKVTSEQVQAIKAVYPSLYREIVQKVTDGLRTAKTPPTYEARKQISILFGIAADPTFSPSFVRAMQTAPGSSSPAKPPSTPRGAPKRKIEGLANATHLPGQVTDSK